MKAVLSVNVMSQYHLFPPFFVNVNVCTNGLLSVHLDKKQTIKKKNGIDMYDSLASLTMEASYIIYS